MNIFDKIFELTKQKPQRVAFPEADTKEIILVAHEVINRQIGFPYLFGSPPEIRKVAQAGGVSLDKMTIVDATDANYVDRIITNYLDIKPAALFDKTALKRKTRDPLYSALIAEAIGEIDCTFAGYTHTTAEVSTAGQTIIGLADGISSLSSIGLINIPGLPGKEGVVLAIGDAAFHVDPTAVQLAMNAIAACDLMNKILGWESRCAILSYSTLGSGVGPNVSKVAQAVKIANEKRHDLLIDGEFQLDAAVDMDIARKKVKRESKVAGQANILIFPAIDAANIGVKIFQQYTNCEMLIPITIGFDKPVQDCSRGSSITEMTRDVAFACLQAGMRSN